MSPDSFVTYVPDRSDAISTRMAAPPVRKGNATRVGEPWPEPWTTSEAEAAALPGHHPGERCTRTRHAARAVPWLPLETSDRADATLGRRGAGHSPTRSHRGARARQRATPTQPLAAGRIEHPPFGPTGAVGVCDTFLDRNTKILVQRDKPVVVRGLVEERALNRGEGGARPGCAP